MAADHDVADLLVADWPQHLDAVLEDIVLNHLLEVNGFGAGAGNDEARVGVVFQDAGDGGGEQVSTLVVEETRDDDNSDHVVGADACRAALWCEASVDDRLVAVEGVVSRAKVFSNDCVGDDGYHERV